MRRRIAASLPELLQNPQPFSTSDPRRLHRRGSKIMSESVIAFNEEETFSFEVSDAALERAGSKCWEGPASSFTVSFCSGMDTCPSYPG